MTSHHRPSGDLTSKVTVAAVVAAIACCALPLLVAAGLITSAGVALRNLTLIGIGAAPAVWLLLRGARHARSRQDVDATAPDTTTPSGGIE